MGGSPPGGTAAARATPYCAAVSRPHTLATTRSPSAPTPRAPCPRRWNRLSVFIELAALLAAAPSATPRHAYCPDHRQRTRAQPLGVRVDKPLETLELPAGPPPCLQRVPQGRVRPARRTVAGALATLPAGAPAHHAKPGRLCRAATQKQCHPALGLEGGENTLSALRLNCPHTTRPSDWADAQTHGPMARHPSTEEHHAGKQDSELFVVVHITRPARR